MSDLHFGGWKYSLGILDAISDIAISSPQNPDGSMQTNFVVDPQFYADVKRLIKVAKDSYERQAPVPAASKPEAASKGAQ